MRQFIDIIENALNTEIIQESRPLESASSYKHIELGEDHGRYQDFEFKNGVEGFGTIRRDKKRVVIAYIRADNKGAGAGRSAVAEVETLAKAEGISLITGEASKPSEGFWEKMGFKLTKGKEDGRKIIKKTLSLAESIHAEGDYRSL